MHDSDAGAKIGTRQHLLVHERGIGQAAQVKPQLGSRPEGKKGLGPTFDDFLHIKTCPKHIRSALIVLHSDSAFDPGAMAQTAAGCAGLQLGRARNSGIAG